MNPIKASQLDEAMARITSGNPRALSRAVTLVENGEPLGVALLERIYANALHPWVIGFTGVGGAGKSTLVPLVAEHFANAGEQVAILAVDPSSPITGGAVLGDRIRSTRPQHERVFFRSLASRGATGGLATCITDVVRLMSAAGRGVVLIETVGAGQSEVAIRDAAHTTVVVTAPGLGDEVQAMKAGIIEIASVLVVNKADRPGADEAATTLQHVIALAPGTMRLKEGLNETEGPRPLNWFPPVLKTSALTGEGVDALIACLTEHRRFLELSGEYVRRNLARDWVRMEERLRALLLERALARASVTGLWRSVEGRLASGETDPLRAAHEILDVMN
jgi:LAO/AO transport system kinase